MRGRLCRRGEPANGVGLRAKGGGRGNFLVFFGGQPALFETLLGRPAIVYSEWLAVVRAQKWESLSTQPQRTAFTTAPEDQESGISSG